MRSLNWIGTSLVPRIANVSETAEPLAAAFQGPRLAPPVPEHRPPNRRFRRAAQANRNRGPKPLPGAFQREAFGKATPLPPDEPDAS